MRHTRLWIVATIIAGIILAGFALSVPHTRDIVSPPGLPTVSSSAPRVVLHDTFKKGIHTITGSVETPNVCTKVTVEVTLIGTASSTQTILLAILVPEDSGICLQEKSTMKFSTTLAAPAHLPIQTTVNGISATTTDS